MGESLDQKGKLKAGPGDPGSSPHADVQQNGNMGGKREDTDQDALRSRINSALRSRLNKEGIFSENYLKTRSDSENAAVGQNPANGKANDDDILSTDNSTYIRARLAQWETVKKELHHEFLNQVNFEEIKGISDSKLNERLRISIEEFVNSNIPPEFAHYGSRMKSELEDELIGLGPLEPLVRDTSITEIMVNGPFDIFIEKAGIIEYADKKFHDEQHLRRIIDRIVSKVGRRIDESSPIVNARLANGSRVNAVIPPLTLDGSSLTIRCFPERCLTVNDLVRTGSMSKDMAKFVRCAISGALNIIVSGGTGSGKTTFLNVASSFIPSRERIVTIEDSAELQLQQRHVVRMETRTANVEGKGEVTIRELVKNALRMRPDRLVIGECRSGEAFDMLQAMNTGHDGSLTTLHANSPFDAVSRFTAMVLMSGVDIPERVIRNQIASAIDLIIHVERMPDGSRKVTHISEILGVDGDTVQMNNIFEFKGKLNKSTGKVTGSHKTMKISPKCSQKLLARGEELPDFVSAES